MPYFGLLPFLQMYKSQISLEEFIVSMPYFGLLPFLPTNSIQMMTVMFHVSMPYFGLLPFLRYASASIDFTGFFSLHFVSNYQTILFSTILSRDFSPFIF